MKLPKRQLKHLNYLITKLLIQICMTHSLDSVILLIPTVAVHWATLPRPCWQGCNKQLRRPYQRSGLGQNMHLMFAISDLLTSDYYKML